MVSIGDTVFLRSDLEADKVYGSVRFNEPNVIGYPLLVEHKSGLFENAFWASGEFGEILISEEMIDYVSSDDELEDADVLGFYNV